MALGSKTQALDRRVNAQPSQLLQGGRELPVEEVVVGGELLDDGVGGVVVLEGLVRAKEGIPQNNLLVVLVAEVAILRIYSPLPSRFQMVTMSRVICLAADGRVGGKLTYQYVWDAMPWGALCSQRCKRSAYRVKPLHMPIGMTLFV